LVQSALRCAPVGCTADFTNGEYVGACDILGEAVLATLHPLVVEDNTCHHAQ